MSVGDVNSNERGSGARYNEGKAPLEQIPLTIWRDYFTGSMALPEWALRVVDKLAGIQRGDAGNYSWAAILQAIPADVMRDAACVFQYGAGKYKQWNWTKGMAWSIPVGCLLRHLLAHASGESTDPESGYSHLGHAGCNILMLYYFSLHYPEGEDWIMELSE